MKYAKEIKEIIDTIPKEHHKNIDRIINFYYRKGVLEVQSLIDDVSNIPPDEIADYGVWHNDSIDGG